MKRKLYVGNLVNTITDSDLQNLFSQAGTVKSAKVFIDFQSGQSQGFGFVVMSSVKEAKSAIAILNGRDLAGHILKVDFARPSREHLVGSGAKPNSGFAGDISIDAPPPERKKRSKGNNMSPKKHTQKPRKTNTGGINISSDNAKISGSVVSGNKVHITPESEGNNMAPRMAGDATIAAPPPDVKKKKKHK